jgi:hypothetical protein
MPNIGKTWPGIRLTNVSFGKLTFALSPTTIPSRMGDLWFYSGALHISFSVPSIANTVGANSHAAG